jgi:hypothetical protein
MKMLSTGISVSLLGITYVNATKKELAKKIKTFKECPKVGIPTQYTNLN